ncbi:hypothetical protein AOLI_G00276840 [Acnodon oligacanthus]
MADIQTAFHAVSRRGPGKQARCTLPFGITSAPEIFHSAMEHIIEGTDGVHVYIDDIVLCSSSLEQHNERLTKVLQSIQRYGLKLNKEKCQIGVKEITLL